MTQHSTTLSMSNPAILTQHRVTQNSVAQFPCQSTCRVGHLSSLSIISQLCRWTSRTPFAYSHKLRACHWLYFLPSTSLVTTVQCYADLGHLVFQLSVFAMWPVSQRKQRRERHSLEWFWGLMGMSVLYQRYQPVTLSSRYLVPQKHRGNGSGTNTKTIWGRQYIILSLISSVSKG